MNDNKNFQAEKLLRRITLLSQENDFETLWTHLMARWDIEINLFDDELSGREFWIQFHDQLEKALEVQLIDENMKRVKRIIHNHFEQLISDGQRSLDEAEKQNILEKIIAEIFGFGVLQPLLVDTETKSVIVNGPKNIYFVNNQGKKSRSQLSFVNDAHLKHTIDKIISGIDRELNENSPIVSVRLPDGSSVSAVVPPISLVGPSLTIDKFNNTPITIEQIIENSTITPEALKFIKVAVESKYSIVICGTPKSGSTTLTNIASSFIPASKRIITIEDKAEFRLRHENVLPLETRFPDLNGDFEVSYKYIVYQARRMQPDRFIFGEPYSSGVYSILNLINMGYSGAIINLHASSVKTALKNLETKAQLDQPDLTVKNIKTQICAAIDLIVFSTKMSDGSRRVTSICELLPELGEHDSFKLNELFAIKSNGEGINETLCATGNKPFYTDKIKENGIQLPRKIFKTDKKNDFKKSNGIELAKKNVSGEYIFVSYSRAQASSVRKLATNLLEAGFQVWLDLWHIPPGSVWTNKIEKAILDCGAVMVVITTDSVTSVNVKDEINLAIDENKTIIPVVLQECKLPFQLRRRQHISLINRGFDEARTDLINAFRQIVPKSKGDSLINL
jgi:pilus assembly protein CpaF